MSSFRIARNKRSASLPLTLLVVAMIVLATGIIWLLVTTPTIKKASKFECTGLGYTGQCVETGKCTGSVFSVATCPKDKPQCCVTSKPPVIGDEGIDTSKKTEGGAETKAGENEAAKIKGSMKFYCKCNAENGYLVGPGWISSFVGLASFKDVGISDAKKGNVDFKAKKDIGVDIQARGTDDIKYCKISLSNVGSSEGACDKDKGPTLKIKLTNPGDYDIVLEGYDKQSGTNPVSVVVDIKVEAATK